MRVFSTYFFPLLYLCFIPVFGCLGTAEEERVDRIRIVGRESADLLGRSVAAVGHVNWNSNGEFTDILVGAPSFDNELGFSDKGAAYLIFGGSDPPNRIGPLPDTETLPKMKVDKFERLPPFPPVTFVGSQAGGNVGFAVSGVGDVNGDGFDDFLIGAPLVRNPNITTTNQNGAAYLVFGGQPLRDKLEACEQVPECVSPTRMIVRSKETGEKGYVVILSEATLEQPFIDPPDNTLANPLYKVAFVLRAGTSQSNFGFSLSGASDVNGDGCPDFLIGAPFNASDRSGIAYLYTGSGPCNGGTDLLDLSVTPNNPPISPLASYTGVGVNLHLGLSTTGIGDVNGDGFADILVGAPGEVPRSGFSGDFQISTNGCGGRGNAYLFLGQSTPTDTFSSNADVIFEGDVKIDFTDPNQNLVAARECFGISVGGMGDLDGDGFPDLGIGAPLHDLSPTSENPDNNEGTAYIFFGDPSLGGNVTLRKNNAQVVLEGSQRNEFFGGSLGGNGMPWTGTPGLSGLWDWNGDGLSDFLVGATNASRGAGTRNGAVYLFYGSLTLSGIIKSDDAPRLSAGEQRLENFGVSVGLAGDFNNDQNPDFLIGSPLNDNEGIIEEFDDPEDVEGLTDNGVAILQLF